MSFLSAEVRFGIRDFLPWSHVSPSLSFTSCLNRYFSTVPVIDRITPFTASTQGGTIITVIGSQFGPSPTATSAVYSSQALTLFGNSVAGSPAPVFACNPPTIASSGGQLTCSFPAYSGGATSFALRYSVCIAVPRFAVQALCVVSAANTLGQFGFSYNAPVISQISVSGTTSPTTGGLCHFLSHFVFVIEPIAASRFHSVRPHYADYFIFSALAGVSVTLTGSDFTASATASVLVNGVAVAITSITSSQIIFTSPTVRFSPLTRCFRGYSFFR